MPILRKAQNIKEFDCYIFHDVDMILEDDRAILGCQSAPSHFSFLIDKFNYTTFYPNLFGGVVALREKQYEAVNGFSNRYLGWGGEDDDFRERVRNRVSTLFFRLLRNSRIFRKFESK